MIFLGLFIFIDQLAKYLVRHWGGFYICNQNISFGMQIPAYLFYLIWIILVLTLIYFYLKQRKLYFILILAGAISNLIDRAIFGCVIDFINLKIWPIFNLADIFITIGVIMLLYKIRTTDSH